MDEEVLLQTITTIQADVFDIKENMALKSDTQQIMSALDHLTNIATKIQEDQTFGIEWIKRLQEQVNQQAEDIRKIKMHLKLA